MASSLGLKRRSSDTAPRCMGLLELAKKYEIDAVKDFVRQHLINDWPVTLKEWKCQQAEIAQLEEMYCKTCHPTRTLDAESLYLSDLFPEPASVVKLCVTYGIREPLPAAFYQLSTIRFEDDYDRWKNEDGTSWQYLDFWDPTQEDCSPLVHWRRTARWSLLDGDLFMRLLTGRSFLHRQQGKIKHFLSTAKDCERPLQCTVEFEDLQDGTEKSSTKHGEPPGFLETLWRRVLEMEARDNLCEPCLKNNWERIEELMRNGWDVLPDVFAVEKI